LTSVGGYMFATLKFQGSEIGTAFLTLGIASIFMPGILGLLADKYFNAEKLQGICHILGAAALYYMSTVSSPSAMFLQCFWFVLLTCQQFH